MPISTTRNDEIAAEAAGIDANNEASNNKQGSGNSDNTRGTAGNQGNRGNIGNGENIGNGGNGGTGGTRDNGGKGAGGNRGENQVNRPSSVGSGYGSPVQDYDGNESISDYVDSSPLTSYRIPNY